MCVLGNDSALAESHVEFEFSSVWNEAPVTKAAHNSRSENPQHFADKLGDFPVRNPSAVCSQTDWFYSTEEGNVVELLRVYKQAEMIDV